jgi:hypothetical protein
VTHDRPSTIGLCLIVKDEAHVLRRCLESARRLVDYVLVVDTGSTDGTPDVVRACLADHNLPGVVRHDAWRDFGSNRTTAVAALREVTWIDYCLMLDADDVLAIDETIAPAAWKHTLDADVYDVAIRCGTIEYARPQLWRNRLDVRYRGVLHEFLEIPDGVSRATARGIRIDAIQDSARNANPRKYADDARVLAEAAAAETDPGLVARYHFYRARCHELAGEWIPALAAYRARAKRGGWPEEVYLSLFGAARMMEHLACAPADVVDAYLAAHETLPTRAEALHAAIRCCRLNGLSEAGWTLARGALPVAKPATGLFLDAMVYDWALRDECALAAWGIGRYAESLALWEALLQDAALPPSERPRIENNAAFARERLPPRAPCVTPTTPQQPVRTQAGRATARRRVSAIVLSNAKTDAHYRMTCECLRSLRANGGADWNVVVVEQSPRDRYGDPSCRVVATDEPFHYNRFLRLGWDALDRQGDVIAILNNDLVFEPGFWPPLEDALRRFDSVSPWCAGYHDAWIAPPHGPYHRGYRPAYEVTGWAMFFNRAVVEAIDFEVLFPDEFSAWFQDSWYAYELERHGQTHALVFASRVAHLFGGSRDLIVPSRAMEWTAAAQAIFDRKVAADRRRDTTPPQP